MELDEYYRPFTGKGWRQQLLEVVKYRCFSEPYLVQWYNELEAAVDDAEVFREILKRDPTPEPFVSEADKEKRKAELREMSRGWLLRDKERRNVEC